MDTPSNETKLLEPTAFLPGDLFEWVGLGQAVASVVIAILVAIIALRQMRIARNQLKLELFEKRHAVFNATRKMLSSVVQSAQPSREEVEEYRVAILDAEFLFDIEMHEYLFDIYKNCNRLISINRNAETLRNNPRHAERYNQLLEQEQALLEALTEPLTNDQGSSFRDKFRPYMQMSHG